MQLALVKIIIEMVLIIHLKIQFRGTSPVPVEPVSVVSVVAKTWKNGQNLLKISNYFTFWTGYNNIPKKSRPFFYNFNFVHSLLEMFSQIFENPSPAFLLIRKINFKKITPSPENNVYSPWK